MCPCEQTRVVIAKEVVLVRGHFSDNQVNATSNFLHEFDQSVPQRTVAYPLPEKVWRKCVYVEVDGLKYIMPLPNVFERD